MAVTRPLAGTENADGAAVPAVDVWFAIRDHEQAAAIQLGTDMVGEPFAVHRDSFEFRSLLRFPPLHVPGAYSLPGAPPHEPTATGSPVRSQDGCSVLPSGA